MRVARQLCMLAPIGAGKVSATLQPWKHEIHIVSNSEETLVCGGVVTRRPEHLLVRIHTA